MSKNDAVMGEIYMVLFILLMHSQLSNLTITNGT